MISCRSDLYKRLKPESEEVEFPGYQGMQIGDIVNVKDPRSREDAWSHAFRGTITEVTCKPCDSADGLGYYYVSDMDGDVYGVDSNDIGEFDDD